MVQQPKTTYQTTIRLDLDVRRALEGYAARNRLRGINAGINHALANYFGGLGLMPDIQHMEIEDAGSG